VLNNDQHSGFKRITALTNYSPKQQYNHSMESSLTASQTADKKLVTKSEIFLWYCCH